VLYETGRGVQQDKVIALALYLDAQEQ